MAGQHLEQGELTAGERQRFLVAGKGARTQVEPERAELYDGAVGFRRAGQCGRRLAAQHRLDTRRELAWIERLGQVVVGAHFEADDAVHFVTLGGEHDDGQHFTLGPQAPANGKAVLVGHHEVQHHQVVTLSREGSVHGGAVGHCIDGITLFTEIAL